MSDLEPSRIYRVALPKKEWDTRFTRYFQRYGRESGVEAALIEAFKARDSEVTFTNAVVALLEQTAATVSPIELLNSIEMGAILRADGRLDEFGDRGIRVRHMISIRQGKTG